MKTPHFIVVSGCNASGKTSLIYRNAKKLDGYEIIIPDKLGFQAIPKLEKALAERKNIVYENIFQEPNLAQRIDEVTSIGYHTSLYQLFLNSLNLSLERVHQRKLIGGLNIEENSVIENFKGNFINIGKYFFYFNESFFIANSSVNEQNKLHAYFIKGKIQYYLENNYGYLRHFFGESNRLGRLSEEAYAIIKKNNTYTSPLLSPLQTLQLL